MTERQIRHFRTMAKACRDTASDLWDEIEGDGNTEPELLGETLKKTLEAIDMLGKTSAALIEAAKA